MAENVHFESFQSRNCLVLQKIFDEITIKIKNKEKKEQFFLPLLVKLLHKKVQQLKSNYFPIRVGAINAKFVSISPAFHDNKNFLRTSR